MYQLDIFSDSGPVQRINTLVAALGGFDRVAAPAAFAALLPGDAPVATHEKLAVLCECLVRWPDHHERQNDVTVRVWVHRLETQILPATDALGDASAAFRRRCWSALAASSEAAGIGPDDGACFAAELHLRAGQWLEAIRSAAPLAGGAQRARVQRWLALGHQRCGQHEPARVAALRYAWLAPQRFSALMAELGDTQLTGDWCSFQKALGDLDASWFPAWYAHENELTRDEKTALATPLPPGDGPAAWRLVVGLKLRERQGLCAALLEDRARLKRLNESFFQFYMQQRAV